MSGVDERVETVRTALLPVWPHLGHGTNDLGPCPVCARFDAGIAALDSLAAAVAGLEQRADEADKELVRSGVEMWRGAVEIVALRQRADEAEKALRQVRDWIRGGVGTESEAAEAMDAVLEASASPEEGAET